MPRRPQRGAKKPPRGFSETFWGLSWGHLGRCSGHLDPYWGYLGGILGHLGALFGDCGATWAIVVFKWPHMSPDFNIDIFCFCFCESLFSLNLGHESKRAYNHAVWGPDSSIYFLVSVGPQVFQMLKLWPQIAASILLTFMHAATWGPDFSIDFVNIYGCCSAQWFCRFREAHSENHRLIYFLKILVQASRTPQEVPRGPKTPPTMKPAQLANERSE